MTTPTIGSCLAEATDRLRSAGVPYPNRETRLLLAHVLGVGQSTIIGHPEYAVCDRSRFLTMVDQRARGVPMAHLLGRREFWSLCFRVTPDTLDPRPDSETLVEAALSAAAGAGRESMSVLDFGTGTGCLLLAVLKELPGAWGVGVDLSPAAAAVARDNARRLGLAERAHFLVADWAAALRGRFDLVVANPPYIASGEIDRLQTEVACYEPRLALDGGADGLECYRTLLPGVKRLLARSGSAVVEVGDGQWDGVAGVGREAGMAPVDAARDLSGTRRSVIFRHRFER